MLGIDLVHIPEFRRQLALGGSTFLEKAFSASEAQNHAPDHLAGLWAAKEAVLKAAGMKPGHWLDICITHDGQGRPGAAVGDDIYEVSIAHHGEYAVAVAQKMP